MATSDHLSFSEGEFIFSQGDSATSFFIIESGRVLIVREYNQQQVPVDVRFVKGFLGELELINHHGGRLYTAIALDQVELKMLKYKDLNHVIGRCDSWVKGIVETLCMRYQETLEVIEEHRIPYESDSLSLQKKIDQVLQDTRKSQIKESF